MQRNRPFYSKRQITKLIAEDKYFIDPRALKTADRDFGWDNDDILKAIKKLQPVTPPFNKSDRKDGNPDIWVDIYIAVGLMEENIYIKFWIDEGILVIYSFHAPDKGN